MEKTTRTEKASKRWRVVAKMPLISEPLVDWFTAENEVGAIAAWRDLAAEIGLPNADKAIVSVSDAREFSCHSFSM